MTCIDKQPENSVSPTTFKAHAVRWAQRDIHSRFEIEYSLWHWTDDASLTLCGRRIMLISDGPAMLPETHDDQARLTCRGCVSKLTARAVTPNAKLNGKAGAEVAKDDRMSCDW